MPLFFRNPEPWQVIFDTSGKSNSNEFYISLENFHRSMELCIYKNSLPSEKIQMNFTDFLEYGKNECISIEIDVSIVLFSSPTTFLLAPRYSLRGV